MAHHVIVEFNLDKAHVFRENPQKFPEDLYLALAHSYPNNEAVLRQYGIKVLNEHHSSDCAELLSKRNAAPELYEACKEALESRNMQISWATLKKIQQALIKADGKEAKTP